LIGLIALAGVAVASGPTHAERRSAKGPVIGSACTPVWRTTPSPQVKQGTLNAVVAVSPRDAWTVGGVVERGGNSGDLIASATPLIERWNGVRWSVSPGPNMSGLLTGVAATSDHDAWAVGFALPSHKHLVLHWNGQRWTRVTLPAAVGATDAVAALSPSDVWVVGANSVPPPGLMERSPTGTGVAGPAPSPAEKRGSRTLPPSRTMTCGSSAMAWARC